MTRGLVREVKSPVRLVHGLVCATGILILGNAGAILATRPANALPNYSAQTGLACGRCHVNPAGGGPRTAFGKAFAANGHKVPSNKKSHKAPAKPKKKTAISMSQVVATQKPDQWLASKVKGTDVFDSNGNKIGSVADILFDASGKIDAYVVRLDIISDMEAKNVAIAPSAFKMVLGKQSELQKLKLSMDEKQLKQAPKFTVSGP